MNSRLCRLDSLTPSVFQGLMQQVLMELNPESGPAFVSVYTDDVLVFSKMVTKHLKHLEVVLSRLAEVGLKLKPAKCRFICQEVGFLGHVISLLGIEKLNTTAYHPQCTGLIERFNRTLTLKTTKVGSQW